MAAAWASLRWDRICLFYLSAIAGAGLILSLNLGPDLTTLVVSFVPLASAVLVLALHNEPLVRSLSLHLGFSGWWLFAWQTPAILALSTVKVDIMMPGVKWAPKFEGVIARISRDLGPEKAEEVKAQLMSYSVHPLVSTVTNALMFGPTVNSIMALGEEAAFRGFLLRELAGLGFWRASLVTGLLSGLWRSTLVLAGLQYPGQTVLGIALTIAVSVAGSPLATLIQWKTHSTVASCIFRGVSNATGSLDELVIIITAGHEHWAGSTGVAGLLIYAATALFIWCIFGDTIRPSVLDSWCARTKKSKTSADFAEEVD